MAIPLLIDSLILGVQHSFEPDHVAAVSVLASEKKYGRQDLRRIIWRSSQWAMGHSFTLILFSLFALLLKTTIPYNLSTLAEIAVGPIMIWLGINAIRRNHELKKMMEAHRRIADHEHKDNFFHLHGKQGEEIAMNPLNRSFWVGMLHGLAGTGGACAVALTLAADNHFMALYIIIVQCIGIFLAMSIYSYVLTYSVSRFIERNQLIFKYINALVGLFSVIIGLWWIYNSLEVLNEFYISIIQLIH